MTNQLKNRSVAEICFMLVCRKALDTPNFFAYQFEHGFQRPDSHTRLSQLYLFAACVFWRREAVTLAVQL